MQQAVNGFGDLDTLDPGPHDDDGDENDDDKKESLSESEEGSS